MKIEDIINEGDVLGFADKLSALTSLPKSSVPTIHRRNRDIEKRASEKITQVKQHENDIKFGYSELEHNFRDFWDGYMYTAITHSRVPETGEYFDIKYDVDNISDDTKQEMLKDCKQFYSIVEKLNLFKALDNYFVYGGDFWDVRNGVIDGYWNLKYSNRYPKNVRENLTRLAHRFGEVTLYLGEDGKIYQDIFGRTYGNVGK